MKRRVTLVEAAGYPKRIVQHVTLRTELEVICPLCNVPLKGDSSTTCLVDLVKRFRVTDKAEDQLETTVRVHVCRNCAQPIIQQKREAMDSLIALLAKQVVDEYMDEIRMQTEDMGAAKKARKKRRGK